MSFIRNLSVLFLLPVPYLHDLLALSQRAHGDLHLSVFLQAEHANAQCGEAARSSHRSFCSGLRSPITVESPLFFMVCPRKRQHLFPIMEVQRKGLAWQLLGPSLPWVA